MKTLIALAFLLAATSAMAYEIPGNPDRRISFGFNFDHAESNSEYTFRGFTQSDFTKISDNSFLLDARVPISSWFTFAVRGGLGKSTNDIFTGEKVESNGYDIGFGFRAYLP